VVLTAWIPDGSDPLWRSPLLSGVLIQCQSYHGDYACSYGEVAMSGGDEMDSSTQMPVCQAHMGTSDYVLSCETLNGTAFHVLSCSGVYPVLESPRA
jgi:hypothetical protein